MNTGLVASIGSYLLDGNRKGCAAECVPGRGADSAKAVNSGDDQTEEGSLPH